MPKNDEVSCPVPSADAPASCSRRELLAGVLAAGLMPLASGAADERAARPRPGDLIVFSDGSRKGEAVGIADVKAGENPIFAYPMDAAARTVRDGSRLNQLLLVRLEPEAIGPRTAPQAAEGVLAYSAICTHYGCVVTLLHANKRSVVCNCHGSTFDAGNNGEVVTGPAPRRLAILPLRAVDGLLVVAAAFSGRLGPPQQ